MPSLQILGKKKKKEGCAYHALKSWIKGVHTIFQLLVVADCKIFFSILTCLCLKICKGHSRDWQSAWENGVSQILAPIAWVMLPSFMFQVSFEPVSNPDYSSLTHRCTTCLAGGREGVVTDRQPPRSCSYSPAAASLSQAIYRRQIQVTDAWQMKKRNKQCSRDWISSTCHAYGAKEDDMTACCGLSKPRKKKGTKSPMKEGGVPKVRKKKTSGGRNTVTTMNHHISNCDRDYLQSAHTAPHKQQPLLIENTKTDRFTHLTHASLLQHQLPTGANAVLCGSDWLS